MSTNYYWHEKPAPCEKCGHDKAKVLHIGTSSLNWVFMLHVDPEESLHTIEDWFERWKELGSKIVSEYGTLTSIEKMKDIILDRENTSSRWNPIEMAGNQAVYGPHGLYRGKQNVTPAENATYDLVEGEFS